MSAESTDANAMVVIKKNTSGDDMELGGSNRR
jgi:hypothetical protein